MNKENDKKERRSLIKTTKSHLKKLSRAGGKHGVRSTTRIVKYGAQNFARNIWLSIVATLVMTITLIILFITVVASVILSNTADSIRDKIDIAYYLKPETSKETLDELSNIIKKDPNIKEVITTTSSEEYAKLLEENKDMEDVISILNDDSMDIGKDVKNSTQAAMHLKVYNVDNLDSIKTLITENNLFQDNLDSSREPDDEVNHAEIDTINSWAKIAKNGGIIAGAIFLFISILIIFNTVRMAVFSRREEIYMMRLVGANKSFIRGPFVVEAQLSGLVAGILSATISYFGFKFLSPRLTNYGIDTTFINTILSKDRVVFLYLAMILLGIIIGSFASNIAAHRYLRKAK